MDGWQAIIWGAACSVGVILFLTIVAYALESAEAVLGDLEAHERVAWEDAQSEGEPVVVESAL